MLKRCWKDWKTRHSGSLSSIHANSSKDALSRLETMTLMAIDLPLRAIRGQIASSIDLVIHLGRLKTGERRVLEIQEIIGLKGEDYDIHPLFWYENGVLNVRDSLIKNRNMIAYGQMKDYESAIENYRANVMSAADSFGDRAEEEDL